jgi:hypothetical protein
VPSFLLLLVIALLLVLAAMPASAKESMTATLMTRVPLGAKPGTTFRIAWNIETPGARTTRRSPDDDRFYVRLLSATGARSTHAYGQLARRHYVATVLVPRGGIGDIEIRLKGWQITPGATRRADALIPITNDPVPG